MDIRTIASCLLFAGSCVFAAALRAWWRGFRERRRLARERRRARERLLAVERERLAAERRVRETARQAMRRLLERHEDALRAACRFEHPSNSHHDR
jgi:hypothetical protein